MQLRRYQRLPNTSGPALFAEQKTYVILELFGMMRPKLTVLAGPRQAAILEQR